MDDTLSFSDDDGSNKAVEQYFKTNFEVRFKKKIDKFLGFSAEEFEDCVYLHNDPLMKQLLCQFEMDKAKVTKTQLPSEVDFSLDKSAALEENIPYRQLISALVQLANTARPNISYAVGYLFRFMHRSTVLL